jgi:hypothetical protein
MSMKQLVVCVMMLLATTLPAATDSLWEHNGSTVRLRGTEVERIFEYEQPRTDLQSAGVNAGTVLFNGKQIDDRLVGTAYRFSKKCGAIGYEVAGFLKANAQTLTLTGRSPQRNATCRIVGYHDDVLVFNDRGTIEQLSNAQTVHAVAAPARKLFVDRIPIEPAFEPDKPTSFIASSGTAQLTFPVLACKSRRTFDRWLQSFHQSSPETGPMIVTEGVKTKGCAALNPGPVEIVRADSQYICVRPKGKASCYWTLRYMVEFG